MNTKPRSSAKSQNGAARLRRGGEAAWFTAFFLRAVPENEAPVHSYGDQRLIEVLLVLADHSGMVALDEEDGLLMVSLSCVGYMDDALKDAKTALAAALTSAGISGYEIVGARMADAPGILNRVTADEPLRLLSVTEVSKALGVSKQRVSTMVRTGKLPAPEAAVGTAPGWLPQTVISVISRRREAEIVNLP